jgi:hypothetical protein
MVLEYDGLCEKTVLYRGLAAPAGAAFFVGSRGGGLVAHPYGWVKTLFK